MTAFAAGFGRVGCAELDAAKREVCMVKRERTSSPLQALVLLNDPQFVEAARVFGQNMVTKHKDDIEALKSKVIKFYKRTVRKR